MTISSPSPNFAQEAVETAAQTKSEAAKGDMQAARKLALNQSQAPVSSPPEGTGRLIDQKV